MITVRDLLGLNSIQKFKLVAGGNGLTRVVTTAGILDYEFINKIDDREGLFKKDSFIISSLLFADNAPQKLLPAIKQLYNDGISGFAYKQIIYDELPLEVIKYANQVGLPIFKFRRNDAFFEDIIYEIVALLRQVSYVSSMEDKINVLLDKYQSDTVPISEIEDIWNANNMPVLVGYVELIQGIDQYKTLISLLKTCCGKNVFICKYGEGIIVAISSYDSNISESIKKMINCYIEKSDIISIGFSSVKNNKEEFLHAIKEALYANIVAHLNDKHEVFYEDIGIYQFIIPEIKSANLQTYMNIYLGELLTSEDDDLLKTAIIYIKEDGDLNQTANIMFCHKNTIRYRINKIHEMLDNNSNDMQFYRNLSFAISIYQVNSYSKK